MNDFLIGSTGYEDVLIEMEEFAHITSAIEQYHTGSGSFNPEQDYHIGISLRAVLPPFTHEHPILSLSRQAPRRMWPIMSGASQKINSFQYRSLKNKYNSDGAVKKSLLCCNFIFSKIIANAACVPNKTEFNLIIQMITNDSRKG